MNLRNINEAFKRQYEPILNESVDNSKRAQLRRDLLKECNYIKRTGGNIYRLEEALHNVIEKHFPDNSWWEVTSCNIINESLNGCTADELCDNIISGIKKDPSSGKLQEYWLEHEYDEQDMRDYIKSSKLAQREYKIWFSYTEYGDNPPPVDSVSGKVLDELLADRDLENNLRAFIRNKLKRNPSGITKLILSELDKRASWYDTHHKSCYCELLDNNTISGSYTFRHDVSVKDIAMGLARQLKRSYGRSQLANYNIEFILNIDDYDEWDQTVFIYGTLANPVVKAFRFNDDGEGDWGSTEYAQLLKRFSHIDVYSLHGPEPYDGDDAE